MEITPIYQHAARNPDRYLYDTHIPNESGWSEGVVAFYAHTTQEAGTVPIYRHDAKDPWRFYYDTHISNNEGWSEGVLAFYAYPSQIPGTVPIYRHHAQDPWRFYYDTSFGNSFGWSEGEVAFYAYPPGWMSSVPDRALLSQMTLPGTHESMATVGRNSTCQTWSLTQQLVNGLRVFDIRVRYMKFPNGEVNFSIHHSHDHQNAFFDSKFPHDTGCTIFVLDQCLDYLNNNPSECIVLLIKQEKDAQIRATFFDAFWKIVDNRNGYNGKPLNELFYTGNSVPQLRDARGRIVFAFVDGDEGAAYQLSNPRWGLYWGNIDYQVVWTNPLPGQQPGLDVENHWKDLMDYKWEKVDAHLVKALGEGPGATVWFTTYVSASRAPAVGYFPSDYAAYLLPKVQAVVVANLAEAPKKWPAWGAYFGTVMMDFPTTELIGLLISASLRYKYV